MKTTLVAMAAANDVGYRVDLNNDGDCNDPGESYVLHPHIPLVDTRVGCTRPEQRDRRVRPGPADAGRHGMLLVPRPEREPQA